MSYDLAVWYPHQRLDDAEAGQVYVALCESRATSLRAHPAVQAFYDELYQKHPEIDDIPDDRIDDHEYCPWSCAHDRSPAHLVMCCVYSQAANVHTLVQELAQRHGLAVFDPQTSRIVYPDGTTGGTAKPWWRFW